MAAKSPIQQAKDTYERVVKRVLTLRREPVASVITNDPNDWVIVLKNRAERIPLPKHEIKDPQPLFSKRMVLLAKIDRRHDGKLLELDMDGTTVVKGGEIIHDALNDTVNKTKATDNSPKPARIEQEATLTR